MALKRLAMSQANFSRTTGLMLALAGLVVVSCGKKDEGGQDASAAAASAAPTTVAADQDAGAIATPTPPPRPVNTTPPRSESIDACCSAISAIKQSGKDTITKRKAEAAAAVCPGIARLVKDGKTSRKDALTQIRSALSGATAPSECN
jgi:hypothetical protein